MSDILQRIKTRGWWEVEIRPTDFLADRVPTLGELETLIRTASVETGLSSLPQVGSAPSERGADYVGQGHETGAYLQTWRFYQSGQLVLYEGMVDDWADRTSGARPSDWQPNVTLSLSDALYTYWQVFELANRLALSPAGSESMLVSISAIGLKDRALKADVPRTVVQHVGRRATITHFPIARRFSRQELVSNSGGLAVEAAGQLLSRFGWDAPVGLIRSLMAAAGGPTPS